VPGEVDGVGTELGLGREGEAAGMKTCEFEMRSAGKNGLGDVGLCHTDAQVVVDCPKASVE
jgi:hypothetical protein